MARRLLGTFLFASVLVQAAPWGVRSNETNAWRLYWDEVYELSFRYPPDLRLVIAPAADLRLDGWARRVSLVPEGSPHQDAGLPVLTVDVFVCDDPTLDPRVPCVDEAWLRGVCEAFERFPLGKQECLPVRHVRQCCV